MSSPYVELKKGCVAACHSVRTQWILLVCIGCRTNVILSGFNAQIKQQLFMTTIIIITMFEKIVLLDSISELRCVFFNNWKT